MKTLFAAALLLSASSLVTAHAQWEILDPGMAVKAPVASPAPTPTPIAQRQSATK
jgi:hypothetical protein